MRKLSESTRNLKTEVYTYESFDEFSEHFEKMQSSGWLGTTAGDCHSHWLTTYTLRDSKTTILPRQ